MWSTTRKRDHLSSRATFGEEGQVAGCKNTAALTNQENSWLSLIPGRKAVWQTPKHNCRSALLQSLCKYVHPQTCLSCCGKEAWATGWQVRQGKKALPQGTELLRSKNTQTLTSLETLPPVSPSPRNSELRRCRRNRAEPSPCSLPPTPGNDRGAQGGKHDSPGIKPNKDSSEETRSSSPCLAHLTATAQRPQQRNFLRSSKNCWKPDIHLCSHWMKMLLWCFLPWIKISLGFFFTSKFHSGILQCRFFAGLLDFLVGYCLHVTLQYAKIYSGSAMKYAGYGTRF